MAKHGGDSGEDHIAKAPAISDSGTARVESNVLLNASPNSSPTERVAQWNAYEANMKTPEQMQSMSYEDLAKYQQDHQRHIQSVIDRISQIGAGINQGQDQMIATNVLGNFELTDHKSAQT